MIRLCAVLLYVVLRLAMKIAIDTVVGLWLKYRPIRRWRTRRATRAEHPDEIAEDFNVPPDEGFMSEAQQSLLRGFLKFAAGALAAKGLIDVGEAAALQVALEALTAGVVGLVGFYLSHKKHAQ
jgi:hypothetical protein